MTDHDALLRAICANPDDDTPRLIFADYLEERDEPDRAAFIRAQVELARTPQWEPFAILCRYRRPVWIDGALFRGSLPQLPEGWNVEWHPHAFRRGLGWRIVIGSLIDWNRLAPRLVEQAPIGELILRDQSTLDDWRAFAATDYTRFLRAIHLEMASPVEPIRALCDSPHATGITDIFFHRASHPGLSFLVADLFKSRLRGSLRGLHFRVGYAGLEDLIDALADCPTACERLTLAVMGLMPDLVRRWCARGGPHRLRELDLHDNYTHGHDWMEALADGLRPWGATLHMLRLSGCGLGVPACRALAGCAALSELRSLDLGRNPLDVHAVAELAHSPYLTGLRSLNLARCTLDDAALQRLIGATFWPNLVELDLRDNPIDDGGARHLLAAPAAPDLTALLLDGHRLGVATRTSLRDRYGERAILDDGLQAFR